MGVTQEYQAHVNLGVDNRETFRPVHPLPARTKFLNFLDISGHRDIPGIILYGLNQEPPLPTTRLRINNNKPALTAANNDKPPTTI